MRPPVIDERDQAILHARRVMLDAAEGPRVGDYVDFADGVKRRISFITPEEWLEPPDPVDCVQTSTDGSFYLGNGYVSFSGSLFGGVKRTDLELTDEKRAGHVWFFHHDYRRAHNGVSSVIPFRVFKCGREAPS